MLTEYSNVTARSAGSTRKSTENTRIARMWVLFPPATHAVRLSVMTVSGENVCTASGIDAGVSSSFPARSVARTRRSCAPSASSARTCGERHTLYAAPSSAHSKVLGSLLLKETLRKAAKDAIAAVRLVKLVSGAVVSARRLAVETFASVAPSANCTL